MVGRQARLRIPGVDATESAHGAGRAVEACGVAEEGVGVVGVAAQDFLGLPRLSLPETDERRPSRGDRGVDVEHGTDGVLIEESHGHRFRQPATVSWGRAWTSAEIRAVVSASRPSSGSRGPPTGKPVASMAALTAWMNGADMIASING